MQIPEQVRVRIKATGAQHSFARTTVEAEPDLYEVLDKDAIDASGFPLPAKANTKTTASRGGSSRTKSTTPDDPAETKE